MYSSHELTGIAILAYPEHVKMSKLKPGGFTAYQKGGFDDGQQERLAGFCRTLDSAGHKWLLSNSDPANTDPADRFFDRIFSGFNISRVLAGRMINSDGKGRGKVTELAIRNY